jgi:hypothetical protein
VFSYPPLVCDERQPEFSVSPREDGALGAIRNPSVLFRRNPRLTLPAIVVYGATIVGVLATPVVPIAVTATSSGSAAPNDSVIA